MVDDINNARGPATFLRPITLMLAAGMTACLGGAAFGGDDYPSKPVTLIVPFSPGGAVDNSARVLAAALGERLGQQFIVENQAGASGGIGYASVARADKDGYTLLVGYSATSNCSPSLFPDLKWDPVKDFAPIGIYGGFSSAFMVHPSIPADTLTAFVDYLKAHPGEVNFGSSGVGSNTHINTERFALVTRTEMTHVPYKGSGDLMTDLLAGNIQFALDGFPAYKGHIESGALKALAIDNTKRNPLAPDVPTTVEAGFSEPLSSSWVALFAPWGTPEPVVAKLSDTLQDFVHSEGFRAGLTKVSLDPLSSTGPELAERIVAESARCADTVKRVGIVLH